MAKTITREFLEDKTIGELRRMVVHDFGIPGMTKKRKEVIIDAILAQVDSGEKEIKKGADRSSKQASSSSNKVPYTPGPVTNMEFSLIGNINKPNEKFGNRNTTTVLVQCGAAKENFPVAGKSVADIKVFLSEVLNIPKGFPQAIVNGKKVEDTYIAQAGDKLEILKPAGSKGDEVSQYMMTWVKNNCFPNS